MQESSSKREREFILQTPTYGVKWAYKKEKTEKNSSKLTPLTADSATKTDSLIIIPQYACALM